MYRRLVVLSRNVEWLGLEHRTGSQRMLRRIEDDDMPSELLETLAGAVEPVKEYERERTQKYDVKAPLNHLVDAVSPESEVARETNTLAQRAVHDSSVRNELRRRLSRWRDNDSLLHAYLEASALRAPLVPLSDALAELGTIGLAALDAIESEHAVTADLRKQQLARVQELAAPHAELLLVVTPAIRALIEAEPQ